MLSGALAASSVEEIGSRLAPIGVSGLVSREGVGKADSAFARKFSIPPLLTESSATLLTQSGSNLGLQRSSTTPNVVGTPLSSSETSKTEVSLVSGTDQALLTGVQAASPPARLGLTTSADTAGIVATSQSAGVGVRLRADTTPASAQPLSAAGIAGRVERASPHPAVVQPRVSLERLGVRERASLQSVALPTVQAVGVATAITPTGKATASLAVLTSDETRQRLIKALSLGGLSLRPALTLDTGVVSPRLEGRARV